MTARAEPRRAAGRRLPGRASARAAARVPGALLTLGLTLGFGPTAEPAAAQDWREFRAARQAGDLGSLSVELLYGVGRLDVGASQTPFLYDARLRYDSERFLPVRHWTVGEDGGRLRIALTSADPADDAGTIRLDDWDLQLDLDDLKSVGDERGQLELRLHPGVPTRLRLGFGAARARLELGGLSIASLRVETGASDTDLSFGAPNRVRMDALELKAGAAEFRAVGLGNARFGEFSFEGGVGDVLLDFTGVWRESARGSIKVGLGQVRLRVPPEIGVRIHRKSILAGFEAPGFEKVGDAYRTPNWETAATRFEIQLEAALGAIEVEIAG